MSKMTQQFVLDFEDLTWLREQGAALGCKNLSKTLHTLIYRYKTIANQLEMYINNNVRKDETIQAATETAAAYREQIVPSKKAMPDLQEWFKKQKILKEH